MMEGEKWLLQVDLWLPQTRGGTCASQYANKCVNGGSKGVTNAVLQKCVPATLVHTSSSLSPSLLHSLHACTEAPPPCWVSTKASLNTRTSFSNFPATKTMSQTNLGNLAFSCPWTSVMSSDKRTKTEAMESSRRALIKWLKCPCPFTCPLI